MNSRRAFFVASVLTLTCLGLGTGGAGASTFAPTSCITSSNLYSASASQLQACGLAEAPFSGTSVIAGGGSAYNYTMPDGEIYSVDSPPAGFDAATASAAEDALYGLPPAPPTSSPGYESWLVLAQSSWASATEEPYLVVSNTPITQPQPTTSNAASPDLTQAPSDNWSGYTQAGTGWTEAETQFTEPTLASTRCSDPAASFWAGIGNQSGALGQTGTDSGAGAPGLHEVFFENLPANAAFPGVTAPAGSLVTANARYLGSGSYSYLVTISGVSHAYSTSNAGYDGSVVETIAERPVANGSLAPLLNYQHITMSSYDGKNLVAMNPSKEWNMTGYATTGAYSSPNFTATQNSCSG